MTSTAKLLPLTLVTLFGCSDGVPDQPTYFDDVAPILAANCNRCHGADPYVEKVSGFRLDRYVKNDDQSLDAWDFRNAIITQAVDLKAPAMPLDYTLTERQRDILARWVETGAAKGTRSNQSPEIVAIEPSNGSITIDQSISITYRASDADGDGLVVAIGYRPPGSAGGTITVSGLGGGMRTVDIDTGVLPSMQTIEFYAIVDDGFSDNPVDNATEGVLLDNVLIDHGVRGTAPMVVLIEPNGGDTLIGTATIIWSATDPDPGDALTIDLDLVTVDAAGIETAVQTIEAGLVNSGSFEWDLSGVPATDSNGPISYKVRVTATDIDAKNVRSDESDASFTVVQGGGTTDLTWADVKPIFLTYCGDCHRQPSRTPALESFRLDKYNVADPEAPTNSDEGVFDVRQLVYQRLVVATSMPPNAEPQPSQADIDMIAEWILAGAPESTGPVDDFPTFTWIFPQPGNVELAAGGIVTLKWTASDPEMLPFTASSISYAQLSAAAAVPATTECNNGPTNWVEIAGVDVTTGSFDWMPPAGGKNYFCLRGEVTDEAGQTTQSLGGVVKR